METERPTARSSPARGVALIATAVVLGLFIVRNGFTFDAETPHGRIDYVLTSRDVVARTAEVVPSPASDHLLVVADLVVAGGVDGGC